MSQYLPTCNFKWVKNIDRIEEKLMRIKNNSSTRYILEADLEYPKELHNIRFAVVYWVSLLHNFIQLSLY